MMLCLLFHWSGLFSGLPRLTRVNVMPELGMISLTQFPQTQVPIYDLQAKLIEVIEVEMPAIYCCEAGGRLYITCAAADGKISLVSFNAALKDRRQQAGISLFMPHLVDGKLYAADIFNIKYSHLPFPNLMRVFDSEHMTYGEDSFFKLPKEVRDDKFNSKGIWIMPWKGGLVGIVQVGGSAYLMTRQYLSQERKEGPFRQKPEPERVPIELESGTLGFSGFKLHRMMPENEARNAMGDYRKKKNLIHTCWLVKGQIFLAYGAWERETTHIGKIDEQFRLSEFMTSPGFAIAAEGKRIWMGAFREGQLDVDVIQLPESAMRP